MKEKCPFGLFLLQDYEFKKVESSSESFNAEDNAVDSEFEGDSQKLQKLAQGEKVMKLIKRIESRPLQHLSKFPKCERFNEQKKN